MKKCPICNSIRIVKNLQGGTKCYRCGWVNNIRRQPKCLECKKNIASYNKSGYCSSCYHRIKRRELYKKNAKKLN